MFAESYKKALSFSLLLLLTISCQQITDEEISSRLSMWDLSHMQMVKHSLNEEDDFYRPAYEQLIENAESELNKGPWSVTFKDIIPPGGTKHDYMSMGPYWWPDSTKADGLPYIRKDGVAKPENRMDRTQLGGLFNGVRTLSLAWFFSDDRKYADRAVELLHVWFIDEDTRMNPHLEYAQAIPGRTDGRGIGIIDARSIYDLVDSITLLERSSAFDQADKAEIRQWFTDYRNWLVDSQHGKDMDVYVNNHSTAYDAQVSSIARYLGDDEFVRQKISAVPENRMNHMIEADGSQPHELRRTRGLSYSVSNLRNFYNSGEMGLKVGVDIFGYANPEGGSLKNALDFMIQYIGKPDTFPYEQISNWESAENGLGILIYRAGRYFNDPEYQRLWEESFAEKLERDWILMVMPGLE
ncbi:MAG: alginate lyase family protein [Balneolales bacterium]